MLRAGRNADARAVARATRSIERTGAMRRMLLLVLAAAGFTPAVAHAVPLLYGVHGGMTIGSLRSHDGNELSKDYSSRYGLFGGGFAETPLSNAFSLRLELNYVPQGGKRDGMQPIQDTSSFPVPPGTPLYADFKTVAKLNYLEFPLLVGWRFGSARQFEAQFGPYGGILLSATKETSGTSSIYTDPQGNDVLTIPPGYPGEGQPVPPQDFTATTDSKSSLKSFNWGLQGGVSLAQSVPGGTALLEVRGGLGMTDIQKSSADGQNATGTMVVAFGYIWNPERD
jgi:hypothetical protein